MGGLPVASKSWTERLRDPRPHEVKPAPISIAGMKKGEIMLVPTASMVDAFIRAIQRGRSLDISTLRKKLAAENGAAITRPITTGFHLRTVAEAALEAYQRGARLDDITPFWRVLDQRTSTAKKLSYGGDLITEQRRREGLR
jgi:hypothetical protein